MERYLDHFREEHIEILQSKVLFRGMNRDEIREIWNMPPIQNGSGQAYTIRGEYYLLNDDGSFTKEGV